jgi:hypothetical protein
MKRIGTLFGMIAVLIAMGSCGSKSQQPVADVDFDSTTFVNINRDSMVYGVCGDESAMNTLQLITDAGDTLTLSIAEANEKGNCLGGFESGDRMAVLLKDKTTASLVINQSALLGEWVMPNPLDGSSDMGIRIMEGGIAESIEQPSLAYRSWRLFNGKLEIVAIREGGGDVEEIGLYEIVSIGPDSLVFKDSEDTFEYSRYKPQEHVVDIQLEEASEDDYRM